MSRERTLGILGKKIGMTRIFRPDGDAIGVTVIECGPCVVLQKRTKAKTAKNRTDGYTALQLAFGPMPKKSLTKAQLGHLKAAGGDDKARRFVREMRVNEEIAGKFEVGGEVRLKDIGLKSGELVDVAGRTKGKGYQGVVKRHGHKGFPATHGTHEYFRHPGSIGNRKWPGRVMKGRRMPGHMGDENLTTQNIRVAEVREDDNVLLVWGSIPGPKGAFVVVHKAIKSQQHQ